ncbi:hypothetical protein [Streptomyces albidoflavus]|uniref:hypothetical protein n=1 Tax=Streptomyces albidoflavus TaxID=1886 RepID=UPI00101E6A21|nr:hypothetical protein [Streptomyces albidoflavus]RZD82208.1 hypothetical protein C0Q63_22460 [Streptomyces albidoflavus]
MLNVAVKVVATSLLIGGASLAGRRFGHRIGGWLVALPLTSGPLAFFLATDHGCAFAARAATGMLAGTISQLALALVYRALAHRGITPALATGCLAFTAATTLLAALNWPTIPTFLLVLAALATGAALTRPTAAAEPASPTSPPGWDIPLRMVVATGVVLGTIALAPVIGPDLSGLLSPFPVLGVVMTVFTHRTDSPTAARAVLDGLIMGLAAPVVFFLVLALALPSIGLTAFLVAAITALATQAATMFAMPSDTAGSGTATHQEH